ncbi:hypothetical protein EON64_19690 [archaeon]|nr:MAG: hypothetical protein EON64_19690 [archaeon]
MLSAINEQLKKGVIPPDPKGYTLIEGIINMPLQQELRGTFLGGPAIPTVAVVGNSSGIIYTFALKAILPSVNL